MDKLFYIPFALVFLVFAFVFRRFIFMFVKAARESHKNNKAPRLSVDAKVVSKYITARGGHNSSVRQTYHATFEVQSGDRIDLTLPAEEFGLLVEGDEGMLSFQGTRYLGFERRY